MDDPQRAGGQEERAKDNSNAIPQPHILDAQGHEYSDTSATPNGKREKIKAYLKQLLAEKPDRHIELALTLAISFFAAVQLMVIWSNNSSTSDQADKMILITQRNERAANKIADASKRNAVAAESFSASAVGIRQGVSDAVTKLNLQADALKNSAAQASRLATDAEKSNANALESDRPWMGGFIQVDNFEIGKKPTHSVVFINSGKRPARVDLVAFRSRFYISFPANPDAEYLFDTTPSTNTVVPGQNAQGVFNDDVALSQPEMDALTSGTLVYFVFAKVEYRDVRTNTKYWTHVCERYIPRMKTPQNNGFRNCTEYNDAN